ncbi:MAG TPA: polymer-forming cytoskeletal protein [Acetobacteraceae bacterium]
MFKRRKPDEPFTAASEPSIPAGLPSGLTDPAVTQETASSDTHQGATSMPQDSGLGVPPFRPAPPKEAPAMSRPPFSPATATPLTPASSIRPGIPPTRSPARDPSERRTLVVGRGISVQGTVQDAERLVVEGTVEATMIHATELAIAPGGIFKGEVEVEDAEIAGTIDGTLTVRASLVVRASGKVLGTARCRRLQVEDGGQITGRMEMISEPAKADTSPRSPAEAAD